MAFEKELLDRLLAGRDPNDVFARDGLVVDLKKSLSERILIADLDEHLDDERVGLGIALGEVARDVLAQSRRSANCFHKLQHIS